MKTATSHPRFCLPLHGLKGRQMETTWANWPTGLRGTSAQFSFSAIQQSHQTLIWLFPQLHWLEFAGTSGIGCIKFLAELCTYWGKACLLFAVGERKAAQCKSGTSSLGFLPSHKLRLLLKCAFLEAILACSRWVANCELVINIHKLS